MSEERFRLPYSSYDQLIQVIKGYQVAGDNASLNEVSRIISVGPTTVSSNNAFLSEIGILEGAKQKSLSMVGRKLARALIHDQQLEVRSYWANVVSGHDFVQKLLAAVQIRRGMDRAALQSHIAYSTGLTKSETVMRGANTLIDILKAAELVAEEDGKFVVSSSSSSTEGWNSADTNDDAPAYDALDGTQLSPPTLVNARGISISLQIQIQCTPDDLDGLGVKIRSLIEDLQRDNASESNTESPTVDEIEAE